MAEFADNGLNKKIVDASAVQKECDGVEAEIASLKVAYEQYFLGVERHPPSKQHEALKQRLARLRASFVRQTAVKFRVQGIQAKMVTYERLWSRTLQEIENGTYKRDLFKAKLHQQKRVAPAAEAPPPVPAQPVPQAKGAPAQPMAGAPKPGATPPLAKAPPPPSAAGLDLSDNKLRAVFNAYISAKKKCQEDVSKISYETMAATLRKQAPELLKKNNAAGIDFKVVIKDGKAVLRAVPK